MTKGKFSELVKRIEAHEQNILITKGEEYTHGNEDRLSSFKEAAVFCGIKPRQVCMNYLVKHFQALASYVKAGEVKNNEPIDGRILDLRVYLGLMMGLLAEERAENSGCKDGSVTFMGETL